METPKHIEERAEHLTVAAPITCNYHEAVAYERGYSVGYIKGATTEHNICMEFAKWCSVNGWIFRPDKQLWSKPNGLDYNTDTQLFTIFLEQYKTGL